MHRSLPLVAMLVSQAIASPGNGHESETTLCESEVRSYETTTYKTKVELTTETHLVDVTVPNYLNSTVTSIHTNIVEQYVTECITTTLYYTNSATATGTDKTTITNTETDNVTVTNINTTIATATGTEHETLTEVDTERETTTETVPTTTYATQTVFSTTFDPCPTECSISAATVNLYFWPSDRPYSYPSTWVDESLDYIFTYPSVYMLIPTAAGYNASGQVGPKTSDWILPLDISEVSTIVGGTATLQLELSDLGTDCPKTAAASAIVTMVDSHCDPILAAPKQVSSWAYPCNACGRFGLFDPPYAAPTLTGPLVEPSTTAEPTTMTAEPIPTETTVPTQTAIPSETTISTNTVAPTDTELPTTGITDAPPAGTDPGVSSTVSATPSIPVASAVKVKSTLGMIFGVFVAVLIA